MFELNNFESVRISLASPNKILSWSHGEVTKPETINYRTQKPEKDGLFCERIFGPKKDWCCACGKYKLIRYRGTVCDRCGVEVTKSSVRRERMGHVQLAAPVTHIWYFKGIPSKIGTLLGMTIKSLEHVIYFVSFVVINPGSTPLKYAQILSDNELQDALEKYGPKAFDYGMGAESIKKMLAALDIDKEIEDCRIMIKEVKSGQKRDKAIKRLDLLQSFKESGNRPEWMVLDVIPVIPPELRPMVQIDGGRFATTDVNELYRRVINRNNRLKKLIDLQAPEVIIRNEKRMLQEAVDALIDNGKRGKSVQNNKGRELKSLAAGLRGKQGRFRNNLLGKRVDYSGRTVIVVGPELKHYQVGLPKEMALELFKPFVMERLVKNQLANHSRSAKRMIEAEKDEVWDALQEVIKDHPVLLNRQPTLHKLSIQAFEPVLIDGKAIRLHPLVCPAFNADFDGDQMAVHVPISPEAQAEARILMLSSNNILKPSDGKSIVTPTQDIVLGCYYLTTMVDKAEGHGKTFKNEDEALRAFDAKKIDLRAKIFVRRSAFEIDGNMDEEETFGRVETTIGRILFNRCFPQDIGILDRSKKENKFAYQINKDIVKKDLNKIIVKTFERHGPTTTSETIDNIKNIGFKYSTLASLSFSIFDANVPNERAKIIKDTELKVKAVENGYADGDYTLSEKIDLNIELWDEAAKNIEDKVTDSLSPENPILMMAKSGARGSIKQIMQLIGMRGIIVNVLGTKEDVPIKGCYILGLSPFEYFRSARGGRKGLADTAMRTSDAGYLTRRLVDVAQDVIVTEEDCFAFLNEKPRGLVIRKFDVDGYTESLASRITGRYTSKMIPKIIAENEMITDEIAAKIENAGIEEVEIRTILTCKCKHGVCAKCYGRDMSNNQTVQVGEAVGIIAAQSVGEPGTQLTMRTKHGGGTKDTAGLVGMQNILKNISYMAADLGASDSAVIIKEEGLPRVEEILEARLPKGAAIMSNVSGEVIEIRRADKSQEIVIRIGVKTHETYKIPFGIKIIVKKGDKVEPGSTLTDGVANPHDILKTRGLKTVQEYLMTEILKVYKTQDIEINNKHLEIIVRQMLQKVKVEDPGETNLQLGSVIDAVEFEAINMSAIQENKKPARAARILMPITKAALRTDSFLSAASFQETSSVLADAAVKGKVDNLIGIKENVIFGKLIPAGTGLKRYRNVGYKVVKQ